MSTPVRRAIYGKLSSDGTLTGTLGAPASGYTWGIYHNAAPDHATPPYVIFSKSSGVPVAEGFFDKVKSPPLTPASALQTEVWMIKAVDRNTTADTAETIAGRITLLLNDRLDTPQLSGGAGTILYLRRESDVEYSELADGDLYQHVGALYRLTYG